MSWVEDARKLLQDFVAPELRGINQRIDDVLITLKSSFDSLQQLQAERDRALDQRLAASEKSTDQRFLAAERASEQRYLALLERIEASRRELSLQINLALANRRIEELERTQQPGRPGEPSTQATV